MMLQIEFQWDNVHARLESVFQSFQDNHVWSLRVLWDEAMEQQWLILYLWPVDAKPGIYCEAHEDIALPRWTFWS